MTVAQYPAQHPQRVLLHNEVHARPSEALAPPLAITHIVMLTDAAGRDASRAHLSTLLRNHHQALPDALTTHLRVDMGASACDGNCTPSSCRGPSWLRPPTMS